MTMGCAGPVRGGDSPVERLREPSLGSARSGHAASSEARRARLVGSCHPREGAAEGQGGEESSSLTAAYEESMLSR